MRAVGLPFALLLASCGFKIVQVTDDDAAGGRPDAPKGTPYRKQITIDRTRVTGTQTQFPVWIVRDQDAELEAHAVEDGADIYFTDAAGAPVPYEIQRWTKATGHLEAWVRADVSDAADTVLELRYGDPSTAAPPRPDEVFASAFVGVWHLDDPLDVPAAPVADATGMHAGTAGGLASANQVAAKLGGGVDFTTVDSRINFTIPITGNGSHTISAWVNQRTANGIDSILTIGSPNANQSRFLHSFYKGGVSAGFYGSNEWTGITDIQNAGWVLLHWTYKGSNKVGHLYRDGMDQGNHTFNTINTVGTDGNLGYAPTQWGPNGTEPATLNGILDEVRVATVDRSASWIATEFENQSAPGMFYRVGDEAQLP